MLDGTERKIIFGNLPPIYETHQGIYADLRAAIESWTETCGIGDIFLKYVRHHLKEFYFLLVTRNTT